MTIKFIPAVCPKCGGELRVPKNLDTLKCMYCGTDIIMHQTNNNPQPNVANWMKLAESVLETNPEEAYGYYQKVLEIEPENFLAWFGRTKSVNNQYKPANSQFELIEMISNKKIFELINDAQKTMEFCPENEKEVIRPQLIREIMVLFMTYRMNFLLFSTVEELSIYDLFNKFKFYFELIDYALVLATRNHSDYEAINECGVDVCKDLVEKMPRGDRGFPYPDLNNKLQHYLNNIREINPSYQQ